jgi:hypothetical protein
VSGGELTRRVARNGGKLLAGGVKISAAAL